MDPQPAAPSPYPSTERPPLRALIVEDSRVDAAVLIQLLRAGGWQVTHERVDRPESFRQALEHRPWDVILCDHTMPGFSAPEALEVLQGTALDIPFLIISGGIQEGVAIQAMKSGASDFIMKGALGRLVPAVERELRDAASRRARRQAEATLRESELRYRSVWENSTDAVLLLDLDPAAAALRLDRPLDRLESRGDDFRRRLREGYLREAAAQKNRFEIIDAAADMATVGARIRAAVERHGG